MKQYLFGVKYLIPYDLVTMKPKGIFEVIGGVEVGREIEQLLLTGGHKDGPYAVEAGEPSNSIKATLKEYPNFAFSLFENAVITEATTETTGYVSALANTKGTSVLNATTGIASVAVTLNKGAELPSGMVVIEAKDATHVDIYLAGDVASGRVPVVSELPKIASNVVIATGTVDVAGFGITLTGGSGTIALVTGDIAFFSTRPSNVLKTSIKVGANAAVNYFGLLLVYPKNSQKQQTIVRFPRVSAIGMGFNGNTREFSEFEQPMTPLLDDAEGILYEIIRTQIE
jgi:hypothetical protein